MPPQENRKKRNNGKNVGAAGSVQYPGRIRGICEPGAICSPLFEDRSRLSLAHSRRMKNAPAKAAPFSDLCCFSSRQ